MIGEIIAIGDELTSGRVTNTTSAFAAQQLFAAGHGVYAMHTIGDTPALIGEALNRAIRRVDFVIVTGGLGPTTDDLTNEAVAAALQRPTSPNDQLLGEIRSRLRPGCSEHASFEKMAWLPLGAEVFNPVERMAGHLLVHEGVPIFFLPGVPSQARMLLKEHVLPRLAQWGDVPRENPVHMRLYRTAGLSECVINRRLAPLEEEGRVKLGYYPVDYEVHVSLTVSAVGESGQALFRDADRRIREALGGHVYGVDQESLAQAVGRLLKDKGLMLAVAESCTGGLIASKITAVPGSSAWFAGGVVAYSNHLKQVLLNVDQDLLRNHGAVSSPVARAMAARLADRVGSRIAVSVTGIAGPDGGSEEKPVGTVYIGLFYNGRVKDALYRFRGTRQEIQEGTAGTALDVVRSALLERQAV